MIDVREVPTELKFLDEVSGCGDFIKIRGKLPGLLFSFGSMKMLTFF
jgi:hypothetical protein